MAFVVSTTGTLSPVVFDDIGGRSLVHPTVSLDLELEFTASELSGSGDLQTALTAGHITAVDANGETISTVSAAASLPTVTKAEAEAGTSTDRRIFTPERINEAILALAGDIRRFPMTVGGELEILTNLGTELVEGLTLVMFSARRGVAGTAGTTTIQLELNGSPVGGAVLSWTNADAAFARKTVVISQATSAGDYVSFRITSVETGSPEDIFAEVRS